MTPSDRRGRHAAAYRWLLHAYPEEYRRDVGEAAVATFMDLYQTEERAHGAFGVARLWITTVPRLLWGGLLERAATRDPEAPPYGWAALSTGIVFLLYGVTLAPTTQWWDASEYIATANIVGIPHPPGNPLFVVLGRAWTIALAPLGLDVATRVNLLSAFMSASAHGLWFLVVHQILGAFTSDRRFRLVGAAVAVLVSATAFTVWYQSNVNEKVYTVSLLTVALLTWLAFRWRETLGRGRDVKLIVLMAFILALSVGNHLMALLAAPAIVLFILVVQPRVLTGWKLYPAVAVAVLAGLSIHLFLPIRAALGPIINEGAPECGSVAEAFLSIATYGRAGCEPLSDALTRSQYTAEGQPGPGFFGPRQAPLASQLLNYLQYFDWQWARGVQGTQTFLAGLRMPFTLLFTGLGVWGAAEHARRDRSGFLYVLTLFGTLSLALVVYLNFKTGFAIPDDAIGLDGREVRDRDYFFTISFSVWGLWAGMGIAALWRLLAERTGAGLLRASPVLAVALIPLVTNWGWADRSRDHSARDFAYNLLQSVEPYAVLFTNGDNDTFPLWYVQEVEGIRRDVTVVATEYLNIPWYGKQLRELTRPCPKGVSPDTDRTLITCQRTYEPDDRVAYTASPTTLPPGIIPLTLPAPPDLPDLPILRLDDTTLDRAGRSFVRIDEPMTIQVGGIRPTIPGGQVIYPWQQVALAIVDTAFVDGRPVYWSTTGTSAATLGLDPYLVRQGLALKMHDGVLSEGAPPGVERLPEELLPATALGRFLDVPRTRILAEEVFIHRGDLPSWDRWPDPATTVHPSSYGWVYQVLAIAAHLAGEQRDTTRYLDAAQAWWRLAD